MFRQSPVAVLRTNELQGTREQFTVTTPTQERRVEMRAQEDKTLATSPHGSRSKSHVRSQLLKSSFRIKALFFNINNQGAFDIKNLAASGPRSGIKLPVQTQTFANFFDIKNRVRLILKTSFLLLISADCRNCTVRISTMAGG